MSRNLRSRITNCALRGADRRIRRIYDVTICEAFDSVGVQSNL
jgi:hypothetical protein